MSVANLGRSRTMSAAVRDSVERGGEGVAEKEIPLPGLGRAQSASAIPLVVRGRLSGLLYLESEQIGYFGPHNERLLRIVGAHLAAALSALEDDSPETAVAVSRPHAAGAAAVRTSPEPAADACPVVYYQADDSVFVGGEYVVRGVPGRILWRMLNEHAADGRTAFTNRELRLDERSACPPAPTTSRRGCSCCAGGSAWAAAASASSGSAAGASNCTSSGRSSSPRSSRAGRCVRPTLDPTQPSSDLLSSDKEIVSDF